MFNKIFNKYGGEKVKGGTLGYEDIRRLLYSHDVDIDCKLESYNDFKKIIGSLDKNQKIDLRLEYENHGPDDNAPRDFDDFYPELVSTIIETRLKPSDEEKEYFDANYKIFTKKKHYEHLMEIKTGERETPVKSISKKKKATLEWKVSKGD